MKLEKTQEYDQWIRSLTKDGKSRGLTYDEIAEKYYPGKYSGNDIRLFVMNLRAQRRLAENDRRDRTPKKAYKVKDADAYLQRKGAWFA